MKSNATKTASDTPKPVRLMDETEVSQLLGVSAASLRRWRLLNKGPQFVKLGHAVRYSQDALIEWLASRPTGGEGSRKSEGIRSR